MIPDFILKPNPDIFLSDNYGILDFETTNLDKGDPVNPENRVILACLQLPDGNTIIAQGVSLLMEHLLEVVSELDFVVAHNAKFECGWLKRLGVNLEHILPFCTQIAEYILRGNHRSYSLSLDECLKRRGMGPKISLVSKMIKSGICPSEIPPKWIRKYCVQDVAATHSLFKHQREELFKTNQQKIFYTKCIQTPVLADIEFNGMKLDPERVEKLYNEQATECARLEAELSEITGGINPDSTKQMAEFLYTTLGFSELKDKAGNPVRTDGGKPSTSAETIGKLKASNQLQRRFLRTKLEYSKLNSSLTKYLTKFKECCENKDLLFAQFNQTVTQTDRLSSTGKKYKVQFHNYDRRYKPLLTTRTPGWSIGEADAKQLEFKVAVWYGQDAQGFEDIANNEDIHAFTASVIGCTRQDAKEHTFKPLYGGVFGTEAEMRYYKAFKEKYKDITATQDSWVDVAMRTGQTVLPTGKVFYYPNLELTRSGYIKGNTNVRNYPVQYLATAEIFPLALVYTWHAMKNSEADAFIINTVHDSIIAEVPPDEIEGFKEVTQYALGNFSRDYLSKVYNIDFNVPLEMEQKFGTHWGE